MRWSSRHTTLVWTNTYDPNHGGIGLLLRSTRIQSDLTSPTSSNTVCWKFVFTAVMYNLLRIHYDCLSRVPWSKKTTKWNTQTQHTERTRMSHFLQQSDTTISRISECQQRHNLTCQFPELSGHILIESQTTQLSISFSTLYMSNIEALTRTLIVTCVGRPQNYYILIIGPYWAARWFLQWCTDWIWP